MIKAIILDENTKSLNSLRGILKLHCPQIDIIAEASTINAAEELISSLNPDLVITETQLSNSSIFDMFDKMIPLHFELIFISANDIDSIKAFKYSAIDFLLKPIDIVELQLAISNARQKLFDRSVINQLGILLSNVNYAAKDDYKIAIPTLEGYVFIQASEVVRCEANGAYTFIFTNNDRKILASKNIKEYENLLPSKSFFRVHNSHLVNLNRILKYNKGRGGSIIMDDGTELAVASRRRDKFLNCFNS